ncbi:MAG: DUF2723 domain-containing protein [candidate division Zixibacteria bacterium]|nr:DUF2723 domain-containing protein [candidate division Zixibacteria bacterium]
MSPSRSYLFRFNRYTFISAFAVFLFSGFFYFLTLYPTFSFVDSGELAAVCTTLGIAHPTGYPLYTLLGRIFSFLQFGQPIYRLIMMSAFWAALTNVILFFSLLLLSELFFKEELNPKLKFSAAILTTFFFSFSPILWSQATINEVYSLNIFLCSLIILLSLYWFKQNQSAENLNHWNLSLIYLITYLVGLSSGNHLLSILLLPALIFLLISTADRKIYSFKSLSLIFGFLILGISIYLYLPIRSSLNTPLNWGDPSTFLNLKNHLTAKIYQSWMFTETKLAFRDNFKHFLSLFFKQFPFWTYPLIFLGFFKAFQQNLKLAIFFLLIILFNLLWSLNYDVKDIEPYFLQTLLTLTFLLYSGLLLLFQILERILFWLRTSEKLRTAISFLVLSILTFLFVLKFPQEFKAQNRSRNYIPYDFSMNLLRSAHKDALILTEVWDYYSSWLYLRFVENKRPDLEIVNTALSEYSWYKNYMRKYYPSFYRRSSQEIDAYNHFALSLESGQFLDSLKASQSFTRMINSFIFKNLADRPVYITIFDAYQGYSGLPTPTEGLLMRFREKNKFYPYEFPDFHLRGIEDPEVPKTNKELVRIAHSALSYYNRGLYLKRFGFEDEANKYFERAYYFKKVLLEYDPNYRFPFF